jgi:hypothetical protein
MRQNIDDFSGSYFAFPEPSEKILTSAVFGGIGILTTILLA